MRHHNGVPDEVLDAQRPNTAEEASANLIMLDGGRAAVTGQMEEPVLAVAGERGGKDRSG